VDLRENGIETMTRIPWTKEFPAAITICDAAGVILEMNDRAAASFEQEGGRALLGANLLDCHPEPSRTKLREMLASGRANAYTIEKGGARKLVYQAPWSEDGRYRGFVEIVIALADPLPHFVRDG
jgi:hypothetical protein